MYYSPVTKCFRLKSCSWTRQITLGYSVYSGSQYSRNTNNISSAFFHLKTAALWKFVCVSTTCNIGVFGNHIRSIATPWLNISWSGVIGARKRNSATLLSWRSFHAFAIASNVRLVCSLLSYRFPLLRSLNSLSGVGWRKCKWRKCSSWRVKMLI